MRIAKTLVSTLVLAGLIVAVGCADEAKPESGVEKHKAKSAPVETTTTTTTTTVASAPDSAPAAVVTTTTTTSAPASAPKK